MCKENMTQQANRTPPDQVQDEFTVLMSLALDNLLDRDEQETFDAYLASYPTLANEWLDWQALDAQLRSAPIIAPPANFLLNFEAKLAQRERRRHLWWGFAFGAVAVMLWLAVMAGVASLGAFVLLGQPDWLTQLIHNLAFAYASVTNGIASLSATAGAIAGTAEARTFGLIYLLVSFSLVTAWIFFLRHSTRTAISARVA